MKFISVGDYLIALDSVQQFQKMVTGRDSEPLLRIKFKDSASPYLDLRGSYIETTLAQVDALTDPKSWEAKYLELLENANKHETEAAQHKTTNILLKQELEGTQEQLTAMEAETNKFQDLYEKTLAHLKQCQDQLVLYSAELQAMKGVIDDDTDSSSGSEQLSPFNSKEYYGS